MMENYVLAANKIWNPDIAKSLSKKVSGNFTLITDKDELILENLTKIHPKFIFFTHWSYIIPAEIHKRYECVIFHMTDLPFGRGGSPLQNLIARGIRETQLSALKCVEEIDAGPVYLKCPLSLSGTAQAIYERAAILIEDMIVDILTKLLQPKPQEGNPVYFTRRTPKESNICRLEDIERVYDYIRMLDAKDYPPAYIETEQLRFEFSNATLQENEVVAHVRIRKKNGQ